MDTKKVLKNIGKIALTVASPPIGAITLAKKEKKLDGFLLGATLSTALCFVEAVYSGFNFNKIYDNPSVIVQRRETNSRTLLMAPLSPIAFALDKEYITQIGEDKKVNYVAGNKIIDFNPETGKHELKMDYNSRFGDSQFHLSSAQETLNRLNDKLSRGDVTYARELLESYETKAREYNEIRTNLDSIVNKMNSELEAQRSKSTGERK